MILPFNGNYGTTQGFNDACCRGAYAKFGMVGHNGIDYGLPCGTPVVAPISGSVSYFWDPGGYGNAVFIRGEGVEVVLAHLQNVYVSSGNVSAGQVIGRSGTTGNSTGCHLHFGVRPYPGYNSSNGFYGYVDPQPYLKKGDQNMPTLASREIVNGFYLTILGREASDADAKNWVGQPVDQVFWGIAGSKERTDFVNYRVEKLYESALQRKGSKEEVSQWYKVPEKNQFADITGSDEAKAVSKKYKECGNSGIDQVTKDQISETNSIVKTIRDLLNKIFK